MISVRLKVASLAEYMVGLHNLFRYYTNPGHIILTPFTKFAVWIPAATAETLIELSLLARTFYRPRYAQKGVSCDNESKWKTSYPMQASLSGSARGGGEKYFLGILHGIDTKRAVMRTSLRTS